MRWLRVVAAVLLLGAAVTLAGPQRVWAALSRAHPGWVLAGLACAAGANLVCALRWRELCRWLGLPVSRGWSVSAYFQGVAVNALLPGAIVGGDVLRAVLLRRLGHPGLEAGLSVLLDRLSGLWMLFVLGAAAVAWGTAGAPTTASDALGTAARGLGLPSLAAAATVAAAALLALPWLALRVTLRWRTGPAAGRLERLRARLAGQGIARPFAIQAAMSGVVQALAVVSLLCATRALGVDLPAWVIAATAVPIFLMATLPVSFGGWGTREAAAAVALGAFGVPASAAIGASVLVGAYALVQAIGGWRALRGGPPLRGPDDPG
jgi:uncharacterized membrane protein YbhN (UPF0104 family)